MEQEYMSGMGKASVVPEDIKGWNWGAFLLNWIWGIGNSTFIALLMFVPLVNIVMMFVLGAKGNEWAWQNRTWRDVAHFKSAQKKWRNAALVLVFVVFPSLFFSLMSMMKGEAYDLSVQAVKTHPGVIALVGENPEPGFFVLGEITYSDEGGKANLNYSIEGDKSAAEVYVYATDVSGKWVLQEVAVIAREQSEVIFAVSPQQ